MWRFPLSCGQVIKHTQFTLGMGVGGQPFDLVWLRGRTSALILLQPKTVANVCFRRGHLGGGRPHDHCNTVRDSPCSRNMHVDTKRTFQQVGGEEVLRAPLGVFPCKSSCTFHRWRDVSEAGYYHLQDVTQTSSQTISPPAYFTYYHLEGCEL